MNRITRLFSEKNQDILNVYFTAGYPTLSDTRTILNALQKSGADIVEIGMPYSDPVADGETIQISNQKSLDNGMTTRLLFEQLENIRTQGITVPILLMGYFNPVYQYGVEDFCKKCQEIGIDGLILPDLPLEEYKLNYKNIFEKYGILNIFLITPQTSDARIQEIDQASEGFIYMVSSASVTGNTVGINSETEAYFSKVNAMNLRNPRLIGFGIKDKSTFSHAAKFASGAIIGSQFIRIISDSKNLSLDIESYIKSIRD
ncbi:MAG: tryptophan synthase subunit alpha [Leadbetterella sp.]